MFAKNRVNTLKKLIKDANLSIKQYLKNTYNRKYNKVIDKSNYSVLVLSIFKNKISFGSLNAIDKVAEFFTYKVHKNKIASMLLLYLKLDEKISELIESAKDLNNFRHDLKE